MPPGGRKTVQTEKAILENTASYQAEKEHYEELAGEEKLLQEEKDSLADNDAAKLKDREIKISQEIRELQKIVADKKQQEQTKNEKRIDTEEILKKQEEKKEEKWSEIEEYLAEMESDMDGVPFDDFSL